MPPRPFEVNPLEDPPVQVLLQQIHGPADLGQAAAGAQPVDHLPRSVDRDLPAA